MRAHTPSWLSLLFVALLFQSAPAQTQNLWLTVYYPTWCQMPLGEQGYGLPPWEIDWTRITHVVHFTNGNVQRTPPYWTYVVDNQQGRNDSIDLFFNGIANPSFAGTHWGDSLITIAHRNGVKVVITIQAVDAANLNYVAEDSSRTEVFVNAVVGFLKRHRYDGAEIDWEGWQTPITSASNVNRLVRRLRAKLDEMQPRGLLLVSPGTPQARLYYPEQDHMVDQYNLQTYDFAYAWSGTLNSNASWYISPLHRGSVPDRFEGQAYDSRGPLQWIQAGHDPKKLGVLIPSFACVYRNVDQLFQRIGDWEVAFDLARRDVLNLLTRGGILGWDNERMMPHISGTATAQVNWPIGLSSGQKFWASFENEQSVVAKVEWAKSVGIGGVGFYDFKGDIEPEKPFGFRNPLHRAAAQALGEQVGLPSGTFSVTPDQLLEPGGTVTLTWTCSNITSASISPGIGAVQASGSVQVAVSSPTTFVLSLQNDQGSRELYATVRLSPVNIAIGRQASASSAERQTLGPNNAVDGNTSTRWSSAAADGQWWQVDLGSTLNIDRVLAVWEGAYARRYTIGVSTDGSSFSDVATVTISNAGERLTEFSPVDARYVRITGLERATSFGISLWEVEVYEALRTTASPTPTGVVESYELQQNYPNPFNPLTRISFTLPEATRGTLKVFDLMGREVAVLIDGDMRAGTTNVDFDAKDVSSGVYLYTLSTPTTTLTRKMVVLR